MMYFLSLSRNNRQPTLQAGFTLVEMMVSMSIFIMTIGMAVGTVIVLLDANGKAQTMQTAVTNASFALDNMSREIRTGLNYYAANSGLPTSGSATQDCSSCSGLSFTEAGGSLTESCTGGTGGGRISYRYNSNDKTVERRLCDGAWESIIAPDVVIDTFYFTVQNTNRTDDLSPLVTMYMEGYVGTISGLDSSFILQSSITQQAIDI